MAFLCGCSASVRMDPSDVRIERDPDTPIPPFRFSASDEALLEEIQRASFLFLWESCDPETGMVYDRSAVSDVHVASVAGIGFQLAALPVAVERGWITRAEGEDRAERILSAIASNPNNRKAGLFYHFVDARDGGPTREAYEKVVSTIDSALFFAGAIVCGQYFGDEVERIGDELLSEADWTFFQGGARDTSEEAGFVSLGWAPRDKDDPTGDGDLLPGYWLDSGAEHRLIMFLAAAAPKESHRISAEQYYRLRRHLGEWNEIGKMVYLPWSGALFTAFFDHCFIDYAGAGMDDPGVHTDVPRARVDWWENSRRLSLMNRERAIENPLGLPTFGANAWGLTAMDTVHGYGVPGLFPMPLEFVNAMPGRDYAEVHVEDQWGRPIPSGEMYVPGDAWGDGTIAPYGAGSAIMFLPDQSVAAMRWMRNLKDSDGEPVVWRAPRDGGYGFLDSFNLGTGWIAHDYVAIDQGPLVLAIENARTGLIWELFHKHEWVKEAMDRLGMDRDSRTLLTE
ncbi:MAG: glucoamylase family protein [Planctomycetota bacterium]